MITVGCNPVNVTYSIGSMYKHAFVIFKRPITSHWHHKIFLLGIWNHQSRSLRYSCITHDTIQGNEIIMMFSGFKYLYSPALRHSIYGMLILCQRLKILDSNLYGAIIRAIDHLESMYFGDPIVVCSVSSHFSHKNPFSHYWVLIFRIINFPNNSITIHFLANLVMALGYVIWSLCGIASYCWWQACEFHGNLLHVGISTKVCKADAWYTWMEREILISPTAGRAYRMCKSHHCSPVWRWM